MAGLAAATRLTRSGVRVILYEAALQAGGRCRSYFDSDLGCRIDNGNHLLVSGNEAAMAYIAEIGAAGTFIAGEVAAFPFVNLATGDRWSIRPNDGQLPWWILTSGRGVKGARPWHYLEILKLRAAGAEMTVREALDPKSPLYERLWRPLCVAALNTEPEHASAELMYSVLADTFGRGGASLRPLLPRDGLSESLVEPALRFLQQEGAEIRFGARLRHLGLDNGGATSLLFVQDNVPVAPGDAVILALPAPIAGDLLPDLAPPDEFRAIVNAHYRYETASLPGGGQHRFVGVIGGDVDWVFVKPGILSTTTSAAERLVDLPAEELAPRLWRDVALALGLEGSPVPPRRVVKEKRATFAATRTQLRRRPPLATRWPNLILAGDWVQTGWPATIEGAIRSGFAAADRVLVPTFEKA